LGGRKKKSHRETKHLNTSRKVLGCCPFSVNYVEKGAPYLFGKIFKNEDPKTIRFKPYLLDNLKV